VGITHARSFAIRALVEAVERPSLKKSVAIVGKRYSNLHSLAVLLHLLADSNANGQKTVATLVYPTVVMMMGKAALSVLFWHRSPVCVVKRP